MRWSLAMMTLCLSVMVFASDNAPGYVLVNADLAELKSDFNEAADQVRLVFIVGPT